MITKRNKLILGVDEVGRGPLAGPVSVCIFVSNSNFTPESIFPNQTIRDSKRANKALKHYIYQTIRDLRELNKHKIDWVVTSKSAKFIDRHGINRSIELCIAQSIRKLQAKGFDFTDAKAYLDGGLKLNSMEFEQETLIKGDEKIGHIAIASILAKLHRDKYMVRLGNKCPEYAWGKNAGYGTSEHIQAIKAYGVSPQHRVTYLQRIIDL